MRICRSMLLRLVVGIIILLVIRPENTGPIDTAQAQGPEGLGPFVSKPVTPTLSQPVRQLPVLPTSQSTGPIPQVNSRRVNLLVLIILVLV